MGEGTASYLKHLGHHPSFIGSGNPLQVASGFLPLAEGKRILFPRAKQSKKSIQKLISHRVDVVDLVVYDNSKLTDFENPNADILVFTSPMNAEAFFEKYPYRGEKIIAIGSTTAKKISEWVAIEVRVAQKPTIESLAEAVLDIIT